MPGPDFFQTGMGKRFYEGTVPAMARSLAGIHEELTRQNDLKERELNIEEPEPEPEQPFPEPEIDYKQNEHLDLLKIREYLSNHTTYLPPCPSCSAGNAMNDDGRQYICKFCDYIVRRE